MKESEQTIVGYLLGELSDPERAVLEENYFTNPQVFDRIVKAENELLDDYACGRLSPQLRERFEQHYLASPERRERAKFAQALGLRLDQVRSDRTAIDARIKLTPWLPLRKLFGQSRPFAFSMALFLLLLTLGGAWLLLRTRGSRDELAQSQAAPAAQEQRDRELKQQPTKEQAQTNDLNDEVSRAPVKSEKSQPKVPERHATPAFVTLLLTAGGLRGADTQPAAELVIPEGIEQVRILLTLREGGYSNYRILLQALNGNTIFSRQGLKPIAAKSGSTFNVIVPAQRFVSGDYILTLRGVRSDAEVDDVSKSIFRVEKK